MKNKLKSIASEYDLLLNNIPTMVTVSYMMGIVFMNLMANKIIFTTGNFGAADGGLLLSWIPFLFGDIITKRYGAKAAIMLNNLSALVNVICVIFFHIVTLFPGNGEDFSAFNQVFGCVWFILLGSTIANIFSGIANSFINMLIGRAMRGNKHEKLEYYLRSYVSTVFGQWFDNFLFALIVFHIFAPIYWGWGFTFQFCITTGFLGAIMELGMECIFGPVGYRILKRWEEKGIGNEWIEKHKEQIV